MSDGTELTYGAKSTILIFRGYRKTIQYSAHYNTPIFRSSSGMLRYQHFAAMVEHGITASKTLLRSEHVVTDDESPSSEGASEGDTEEYDGYDADEGLPMSDREGETLSKRSPHGTHTHACEQSHENLQPHADDAQATWPFL